MEREPSRQRTDPPKRERAHSPHPPIRLPGRAPPRAA